MTQIGTCNICRASTNGIRLDQTMDDTTNLEAGPRWIYYKSFMKDRKMQVHFGPIQCHLCAECIAVKNLDSESI